MLSLEEKNKQSIEKYLTKVRKIAWRINSVHPSSLGLHPVVYFYSADGRHKTASFYAVTALIQELENTNSFLDFIKAREEFEKLLLNYDYLIQDINRYYRQAIKSYIHIKDFYIDCINLLNTGKGGDEVISEIIKKPKYKYLKVTRPADSVIESSDFSRERKSAIFIKEALKNALRCKICNGYIHSNSITFDHIQRKEDGGLGDVENGQLVHPYCNSTIKN